MWWAVPFVPARDELFQTNQKTVFLNLILNTSFILKNCVKNITVGKLGTPRPEGAR
jgi:hypothetical protein